MHDMEVNGGLAWPEEGKILVYLGCPLDPPPRTRMLGETLADSFAEAEDWLRTRAKQDYEAAFSLPRFKRIPSIIQRVFKAGIPGSVHWVYDGAFGVELGDRKAEVSSWADAEAWLAEHGAGTSLSALSFNRRERASNLVARNARGA
jgi:hypothetical protein